MARYLNSVPMLSRQWWVEGYVWQCPADMRDQLPDGVTYIGALPPDAILVVTQSPESPMAVATAWPLSTTNPTHREDGPPAPLATIDDAGRYMHLESFSLPLDEDEKEHAGPTFCTFLCADTAGVERLCDD